MCPSYDGFIILNPRASSSVCGIRNAVLSGSRLAGPKISGVLCELRVLMEVGAICLQSMCDQSRSGDSQEEVTAAALSGEVGKGTVSTMDAERGQSHWDQADSMNGMQNPHRIPGTWDPASPQSPHSESKVLGLGLAPGLTSPQPSQRPGLAFLPSTYPHAAAALCQTALTSGIQSDWDSKQPA